MMEQREKLIELMLKCNADNELFDCFRDRPQYRQAAEILADYLYRSATLTYELSDFGKTVFPTREEAEKALSKRKGGDEL